MGEMFGRYRCGAPLGARGAGEVRRAPDTSLDRFAALTMPHSEALPVGTDEPPEGPERVGRVEVWQR